MFYSTWNLQTCCLIYFLVSCPIRSMELVVEQVGGGGGWVGNGMDYRPER